MYRQGLLKINIKMTETVDFNCYDEKNGFLRVGPGQMVKTAEIYTEIYSGSTGKFGDLKLWSRLV